MQVFEVLASGPLTTVQDLGRYGYAHLGVSQTGAMDEYAYRWSQKLLDDTEGNALEILLSGLKLKALNPSTIAVCGADLGFSINGQRRDIWSSYHIQKGDILSFEENVSGLRAYLAVKGGFKVEKIEGSYAYSAKENKGLKVLKGTFLSATKSQTRDIRRVGQGHIPLYTKVLNLRILLAANASSEILENSYTLSPNINAMGYKLQGKPLSSSQGGIISEGIPFGSVQVPPDGQPIILLKERQSIGGYENLGTVLAKDCFALAQAPIGATLSFQAISIEEAQKEMRDFYTFFKHRPL